MPARGDCIIAVLRRPFWLLAAAASFAAYFLLLFYCLAFPAPAPALATSGDIAVRNALTGSLLWGLRGVQAVTLSFAIFIALKRPRDPVACAGALVLATAGVYSVVLPGQLWEVWARTPIAIGALLWVPLLCTVASGVLLLIFFGLVPMSTRIRPRMLAIAAAPMAAATAAYGLELMRDFYGRRPVHVPDGLTNAVLVMNVAYMAAAVALLAWRERRERDQNSARRARVLLTGGAIGAGAAIMVILIGRFATPPFSDTALARVLITTDTILLLALPFSFAYAILRHRLVDAGVAIRLGVRYAIARRALLSIVPMAAVALVIDLSTHTGQPLGEIAATHGVAYLGIAAAALIAHRSRQRWLDALDRRFFRKRYDARRILIDLVDEIRDAGGVDAVARLGVDRIAEALDPEFVSMGIREDGRDAYRAVAEVGVAPALPAAHSRVMELVRLLARPVDVTPGVTAWLTGRLPAEDIDYLRASRIEAIVPVGARKTSDAGLIVLGPRKSEEPYSREDLELLGAIASAIGMRLAPRSAPASQVPRVLAARYRLNRLIARGGMGAVYEATDTSLDRLVAVKVIREDLVASDDAAARFQQEARAAAGFSHPNVVTVHDFGVDDGDAFLVMELLHGQSLREHLTEPAGPARVLALLEPVADAIEAAHARGLIHRDLKPENIVRIEDSRGERLKVLDFGIARSMHGPALTGGALAGTPMYMSPEQLRGEPPGPGWDVWALTVIAFEMLSGQHPFAGDRSARQGLDPAISIFFDRALSPAASDRPATPRALVDGLKAAHESSGV